MAHTRTSELCQRVRASALPLAVSAAVLAIVISTACSSPGHRSAPRPATTTPTAQLATFRVTGAEVPATGATSLPDAVLSGVVATLNRYLDSAFVAPLRSGAAPVDVASVFTAAAAPRLAGPDRATLVDEGGPAAGRPVGLDDATVALTGLLDSDGSIALVAARVEVALHAGSNNAATRIARSGELVLVPDAGGWKIDGYDLRVARDPIVTTASGGSS